MKDITEFTNNDLQLVETTTMKGKNLLESQLENLEYAQEFGIDLNFFLQEGILFQNDAFRTYILQKLAENSIEVNTTLKIMNTFSEQYNINLASVPESGLVR